MVLENKLGITNQIELAKSEERLSKKKAKQLFDSGIIHTLPVGTFAGLAAIHQFLFEDIYHFAGKIRDVNLAKGATVFARVMFLQPALQYIDRMPHTTFQEILEKYVEMNIAHPFREGNGRATRIWLDLMLKQGIQRVIDWNLVDKEQYLFAMQQSVLNDAIIKSLLMPALTEQVTNRALFMKGIDISYYYEGYSEYQTEQL